MKQLGYLSIVFLLFGLLPAALPEGSAPGTIAAAQPAKMPPRTVSVQAGAGQDTVEPMRVASLCSCVCKVVTAPSERSTPGVLPLGRVCGIFWGPTSELCRCVGDRGAMGSSGGAGSSDHLLPSTTWVSSPMTEPPEVCLLRVRPYVSSFPYFYACQGCVDVCARSQRAGPSRQSEVALG